MTKITSIDRATLPMIEQRMTAALKDLGDALSIDFSYASGSHFRAQNAAQTEPDCPRYRHG